MAASPIPEGWVLETTVAEDGTKVECYLCPATDQRFYTYDDLMRYVRYAKAAKLSIYSPYFVPMIKKEDDAAAKKEEGQS